MKVKKIRTKKEIKLIKMDIAFIILCLIWTNISLIIFNKTNLIEIILNKRYLAEYNLKLAILMGGFGSIYLFISKTYLIVIIYIAYRLSRGNVINQNRKYEVIENIEYYREMFENLSAAQISMIEDLEIEEKKTYQLQY